MGLAFTHGGAKETHRYVTPQRIWIALLQSFSENGLLSFMRKIKFTHERKLGRVDEARQPKRVGRSPVALLQRSSLR